MIYTTYSNTNNRYNRVLNLVAVAHLRETANHLGAIGGWCAQEERVLERAALIPDGVSIEQYFEYKKNILEIAETRINNRAAGYINIKLALLYDFPSCEVASVYVG